MEQNDAPTEDEVRGAFRWMSSWFGIGHAVNTIPLVLASAYLDEDVAYLGNAIFYATTVIVALAVSAPAVNAIGVKNGLIVGMGMYVLYALGYNVASAASSQALVMQYVSYTSGCICGGVAAGLLWTAQGAYFVRVASYISSLSPGQTEDKRQEENARLAGIFATWYLVAEIVGKIAVPALDYFGMKQAWVATLFTTLGFLSTIMIAWLPPPPPDRAQEARSQQDTSGTEKMLAVMRLWRVPELWLLSFTNITFGFSSAYMNGAFSAKYAVPAIGKSNIALYNGMNVVSATLMARPLAYISYRAGKVVILCIGALSFTGMAVSVIFTNCCVEWGWKIAFLYIIQGIGRGVYESPNKAVFADFFPGSESDTAFANCYLQMAAASALCFLLSGSLAGRLPYIILMTAVPIPFFYFAAREWRQQKLSGEASPLVIH